MNNLFPSIPADFYIAALPILILCVGSIVAMLQSVLKPFEGKGSVFFVLIISLLSSLIAALWKVPGESYLGGAYLSGELAKFGQAFILVVSTVIVLLFKDSQLKGHFLKGEISCLYQMVIAGMLTMISSDDLITLFIGLELSSIGIYALVGYTKPTRSSQEGAMKYFILGSFATALLLFGFGLIYASTGSLYLKEIFEKLPKIADHSWIQLGGLLTIVGLSFKLALAPFHLWAPDAYEGAPTGITALMATCVKVMILIVTMRITSGALQPMISQWLPMFMFVAIVSMLFGNILALVQSSLKRMLAYSSVAHSGYMAVAICAISSNQPLPYQAILFYLIGYSLASLVAFGVLMWLENSEMENINLDDITGLAKRHPWASFALATAMFSFAGLPPTVGFMGKFFVFNAALHSELYSLILIGIIGSSISLYYYLRVIVNMYMKEPKEAVTKNPVPQRSLLFSTVLGVALIGTLLLGTVLPGPVLDRVRVPAESIATSE